MKSSERRDKHVTRPVGWLLRNLADIDGGILKG
jgi:hypothetical protein